MNLRVLASSIVLLTALALLGYGFHRYINAAMGISESVLDSFWQTWAIAIGASILAAFAYPHVRGVCRGDRLAASVPRTHSTPAGAFAFLEQASVIALENGRVGGRIQVRLPNGRTGEGVISSYAGTITPATIQLTETEVA